MFREFYLFFSIIIVHECGHFFAAKLFNWKVDKISIYPYGGLTKFSDKLNVDLYQELIVLVTGPIFQLIYYFIIIKFLRHQDQMILSAYNYGILLFNILPIYPLDGGKLVNILLSIVKPYKKSLNISINSSFAFLFILFCISFRNLFANNLFLIGIILLTKLVEEYKKKRMYEEKFFLERYLEPVKFKKIKIISDKNDMYRNKRHVVLNNGKYITEKEFLQKKFQR